MGGDGIKITVVVQQRQALDNTECCNDDIDGFSDRDSRFSKLPVIPGALKSNLVSAYPPKGKRLQKRFRGPEILV